MTYDPDNAVIKQGLPEDVIFSGTIIEVIQGKVKDFISTSGLEKWKDPNQLAIELEMEISHADQKHRFKRVFTYKTEGGKVVYTLQSKIGCFAQKYNSLPKPGVDIKAIADKDGFLRLKLD